MAQNMIESVRKAELEASEAEKSAAKRKEEILEAARSEAGAAAAAGEKSAHESAQNLLAQTQAECEKIKAEASLEIAQKISDLQKNASRRQPQAAAAILAEFS